MNDPNESASSNRLAVETRLTQIGRPHDPSQPFVNQPVVRASTVLFEDTAAMLGGKAKYSYGRRGTPTSDALTDAISNLEGAVGTVVTPSGLAAVSVAMLSVLKSGDHVLVTDSAYQPTRDLCNELLARLGIEVTYFDPLIGAGLEALFRSNTRAVYLESPGSLTFEIQDVPAIAAVARARDAIVLMDNTWATPLFFRPLDVGVDISIMAATKYVVGHSDAMLGTIAAGPRAWNEVHRTYGMLGMFTGPDDMYLALRGLRTLDVRLKRHQENAMQIATWLSQRPEVSRVLYPALPSHPGHAIWKRDFKGASGLLSLILAKPYSSKAIAAMLDGLQLFGLGYSWGGFESLAIPANPSHVRTATPWTAEGPLIRFHIGLEAPADLISDLDAGFERLASPT